MKTSDVYIPVERKVEVEKVVERPYDVFIDVPKEIIREVPVPRERVVDKVVSQTVVRPHRVEEIVNEIVVQKQIPRDREVTKEVKVEVPRYVDKEVVVYVDVPVPKYVDVSYEVPKVVEITKEVEFEKIIEVPVERIV